MLPRRATRSALALLFAASLCIAPLASEASPASSALMLVEQGKSREADGDELTALKRYGDALSLDGACEPAYLALGALRTKRGEASEAEEVYSQAIARVPASTDALVQRAHVRRLLAKLDLAADDVGHALLAIGATGTAQEIAALRELVAIKRAQHEPAAELPGWRRLLAIARGSGDASLASEASVQTRALGIFVGEVDPALGGRSDEDPARRSLASIARHL